MIGSCELKARVEESLGTVLDPDFFGQAEQYARRKLDMCNERAGRIYGEDGYSIKLSEWKDYSPRRIVLPPEPKKPAQAKEPKRPGKPPAAAAKTYTVKAGDCLWNIAKKFYGKGGDYYDTYDVIQVSGARVVIGVGATVTAAVNAANLRKV